jgi:hypothetical protein
MRKLLTALSLATLILILPACNSIQTVTTTTTATATATFISITSGFKTYNNPDFGFSLDYLLDWSFSENSSSATSTDYTFQTPVTFVSSPRPLNTDMGMCFVSVQVVDLSALSFSEWSSEVLSSASYSNMTNPTEIILAPSSSQVTESGQTYLGGIPASYLMYSAGLGPEFWQGQEVWAQFGSKGFLIFVSVYSPAKYTDFEPVVQTMIDSFHVSGFPH